jgi:hypothetical protein
MPNTLLLPILAAKEVNVPKATNPETLIVALAGSPIVIDNREFQPKPSSNINLVINTIDRNIILMQNCSCYQPFSSFHFQTPKKIQNLENFELGALFYLFYFSTCSLIKSLIL